MMSIALSLADIAAQIARSLVRVSSNDQMAQIATPLLYPGGSMVSVEFSRRRAGYLVTDAGGARREAELMGGERSFARVAPEIAERFGVRFDHNMIFDLDVAESDLAVAVISIANAAKTAVETTATHLAAGEPADFRISLWNRLEGLYGPSKVTRKRRVRGASDEWEFDATVLMKERLTLFEVVAPHPNAVNSAVTKFLDIQDLGDNAPRRIAVVIKKKDTPHLPVLARTAEIVPLDAPDKVFLRVG